MTRRTQQLLDPEQIGREAQNLEASLRTRIIGQDEAIQQVVDVYQAFLLGMNSPGRPVGNFLFLGPTGTGKTRLVEAIAESLGVDRRAVVKIDCGEFQHSHEIAKLIGSPPGYLGHRETPPVLSQEALNQFHTEKLKLSIVLFDEIEKASDALSNLLLGILDRATLTLGDNRRVDFSRAMIFMTGNVGAAEMAETARQRFGFTGCCAPASRMEVVATEAARRRFSPEFLNRSDKVVVFRALGETELRRILEIELRSVRERFGNRMPFLFSLTESTKGYLLQEGTDARYGARHLKRAIERLVVHPLCNLIASGQLCTGDWIRVAVENERQLLAFYKIAENVGLSEMSSLDAGEVDLAGAGMSACALVATFPSSNVRSIRRA